ncbi:MAG: ACP phosphodiesterase [Bacteroidetes bacterium]|nr:ACP phosphodiesterase [Bacteroidota bacterium]
MNYLAHAYLSGADRDLSVGNFIADHVKGKAYLDYPEAIQKGILLHRNIDHFTDLHPLFRKNASLLFPKYRHYSRVIVDMFFDHFLAAQWHRFHPYSLEEFSQKFYRTMNDSFELIPPASKKILPVLSKHNWFVAYRSLEGLQTILYQMSQRTRFPIDMSLAIKDLKNNYYDIENDFYLFFEEIVDFVAEKKAQYLK